MPTYDYRCGACEHRFEHYQSMSEALLRKCPACGRAKLERLIGAGAGILFKGSGFYQTDYKSSGPPKSEGEVKPAPAGSEAKGAPARPGKDGGGAADAGDARKGAGSQSDSGAGKSADKSADKAGGGPASTDKAPAAPAPAPTDTPRGRPPRRGN